jgi:site-specific recombinase XerD
VSGDPDRSNPGDSDLESAIQARLDRLDSGNYKRNNEYVLTAFADFLRERGVRDLEAVSEQDCRRYAQHLADEVQADELAASSATTYYDVVRAWLGWCVRDGRLPENPADSLRATEDLPEDSGDTDRQYWPPDARDQLLAHMDAVVDEANDEGDRLQQYQVHRDRALIAVLAWSGARGAEIVRDPDDPQRDGVTWGDVDLDTGVMQVFGKTREYQDVSLLAPALTSLDRYHRLVDPPDSWPVFPTLHPPNMYTHVRHEADGDVEDLLDVDGPLAVMRERDIPPKALSLQATRKLLQRRCEGAGVAVDGEYLKPHGGRRGLGHELYAEQAELAQEMLRHQNIGTTHESYRDVRAVARKEAAEDALFDTADNNE